MMTKYLPFPTIRSKFAAAILFLLPVAPVCAQNAPASGSTASPAKSHQAQPSGAPAQVTPALAPITDAKPSQGNLASAVTPVTEPNRAQAYYHLALASVYEDDAVSEGRSDEVNQAIEQYKLALNADPNSAELNDDLADLYFRVGRIHDAEVTARALLKNSPNDIDAHKLLGRIYLRQLGEGENGGASASSSSNVLDQAIAEFQKIVALQPKSVEDHMVLGQLYTVKHLPDKAEAEFKTAQAIEPESEEVVLNLARLYAESGDLQHAVKAIEAVPEDGRTPKMEFTLGALYDQLKQPKDAIAAYQRANDLEPGDSQTMDALAQALLSSDQLDEALKQYQALAEANPDDTDALVHIGEIQRRQGKYEEALATIRKARKIDPNSLEAGFNEGLLLDILGRFDEAVQAYQSMLDQNSISHANGAYTDEEKNNRSIFLERLGAVYLEENKTDQAISAYQKMIDLGGSYAARGYQGQVDAYRNAHEFDKAIEVSRKAVAANPKDRATGPDFVVNSAETVEHEKITIGSRVALNKQTLAVMGVLPRRSTRSSRRARSSTSRTSPTRTSAASPTRSATSGNPSNIPSCAPSSTGKVGVDPPKGVLLIGSPGTGKTLVAKAVAHHTHATFVRLVGSELVQKVHRGGRSTRPGSSSS